MSTLAEKINAPARKEEKSVVAKAKKVVKKAIKRK